VSEPPSMPTKQFLRSYGVALSWDNLSTSAQIDVDLQAVIVNDSGTIADAVFFDRLTAFDNAVQHGGDSLDGDKEGYDEMIWVQPHRLPESVHLIIFVVGIYHGGTLMDVDNGVISVFDIHGVVARIPLSRSFGSVECVALMKNCGAGVWNFHKVDESPQPGQHFVDILEPTIGDVIRKHIPGAPQCKMTFNATMQKGHVVDVPLGWLEATCSVGIGWDLMPSVRMGKGVDLDVSAVLFNEEHDYIGSVTCDEPELFGARHSGDNPNGSGIGDDEHIDLDLCEIPEHVSQIFFVVNVRTPGFYLSYIQSGYCRFVGGGGELGRYDFANGEKKPGKIFARLLRSSWRGGGPTNRWCFQMIGKYCFGRSWRASVPTMKEICRTCPLELQGRSRLSLDESNDALVRQQSDVSSRRRSRRYTCSVSLSESLSAWKAIPEHSEPSTNPTGGEGRQQQQGQGQGRARFLMSL